jgi:hypothetical protein
VPSFELRYEELQVLAVGIVAGRCRYAVQAADQSGESRQVFLALFCRQVAPPVLAFRRCLVQRKLVLDVGEC